MGAKKIQRRTSKIEINENAKKIRPSCEIMPTLWTVIFVAQKMGARLGLSEVLLRPVS
ncbi:hypothetical protein SAMN06296008_101364 [Polynucleobacter kasalickyi]|uniref:Uncharacterized protein n=1 Tax=Polynucleobacter kasalickyi TaxID=1938817 RepID=A0A1W1Y4K3_9BURK|nr:hypothetical protein SAMN06296008_101364 [Polynucleobacter kasalickyi]